MSSAWVLLARVGRETFAFPLGDILEVAEAPEVTTLPMLPRGVVGQAVHRDRLLPVLDAGALLGAVREGKDKGGVLLVIDADGERAALWADDVVDLVPFDASKVRQLPSAGANAAVLTGVLDLGGMLAGVVAMDSVRATVFARLTMETA